MSRRADNGLPAPRAIPAYKEEAAPNFHLECFVYYRTLLRPFLHYKFLALSTRIAFAPEPLHYHSHSLCSFVIVDSTFLDRLADYFDIVVVLKHTWSWRGLTGISGP